MVELRKITEDNFIDAFNLKLARGQDNFVSHPIRSLALLRDLAVRQMQTLTQISTEHLPLLPSGKSDTE